MTVPAGIYDSIYAKADRLPGYDRYCRYRDLGAVLGQAPRFLAAQEAAYWFIRSELDSLPPAARILEIGSGLGYLTYSIHAAGYNITGIDISNDAVTRAR